MAAPLPPYRTLIDRSAAFADLIPIGNAFTREVFDGPFYLSPSRSPELPAINLVFVQSKDGNTGAKNPAALGGGRVDAHVVYEGLSRVGADAVLAGAATFCGSRSILSVWHPQLVALRAELGLPRHPAQIVLSAIRLDLDHERFANLPMLRTFVLTSPEGHQRVRAALESRPWVTPVVMEGEDGLVDAARSLRDHGIRRISCIGGARTATSLLDADLVQDLYLTTAPRAGGEPGTPFYRGRHAPALDLVVRKQGTAAETGVMFEHLRTVSRDRGGSARAGQ